MREERSYQLMFCWSYKHEHWRRVWMLHISGLIVQQILGAVCCAEVTRIAMCAICSQSLLSFWDVSHTTYTFYCKNPNEYNHFARNCSRVWQLVQWLHWSRHGAYSSFFSVVCYWLINVILWLICQLKNHKQHFNTPAKFYLNYNFPAAVVWLKCVHPFTDTCL